VTFTDDASADACVAVGEVVTIDGGVQVVNGCPSTPIDTLSLEKMPSGSCRSCEGMCVLVTQSPCEFGDAGMRSLHTWSCLCRDGEWACASLQVVIHCPPITRPGVPAATDAAVD
jgi:hypothetical protein